MLVGVDFDNTIVCYDQVFYSAAVKKGLIPSEVAATKNGVRDFLRRANKEDQWTELQGYVYGVEIMEAKAFSGALTFFKTCWRNRIPAVIISHKTRHPIAGPNYDLHAAAARWLEENDFIETPKTGLDPGNVLLALTKAEKIERIRQSGCTHFIDDLPEFLAEAGFPKEAKRILFDPNNQHTDFDLGPRARSWREITRLILAEKERQT